DNLPLGQMLYPALSTVDLDYGKLADEAIKFILRNDEKFSPHRVLITPQLLIRESTLSPEMQQ
ncbi:MAG: substrate-binding domain-containing protein, partial [Lentisphaeria bacterium]|nr:substrate-binding domain-containing protein [Lentisphaeria bacterium]